MGFFDATTLNEGAMYAGLNFMDLVENTSIPDLPVSSSLVEDALMSIAESEENYNNIMKACAYNELANFQENGTEYVFTEASASGFIATAKQFFAKMWQKIQTLFKKFAAMIGQFVQSDKTFVEKNKNIIVSGLANIPKDAKFKGYAFSGLSTWVTAVDAEKATAIADLARHDAIKAEETFKKESDDYDRDKEMDKIRGRVAAGSGEMNQSEFNKAMYKKFRGSEEKTEINITSASVNECMKVLTGAAEVKDNANKAYKALKEYFDKIDASLNKASKAVGDSYGKDGADAQNISNGLVYIKRAIDKNKMTASVFQAGNGIYLTCLKDYSRQCKSICVKVATYKDASKAKHEGAAFTHYEGASFLENVVLK